MRRFITTEKKRLALDKVWRKYDRAAYLFTSAKGVNAAAQKMAWNVMVDLRAQIEDFVYDNGGTVE